ncbi:DUF4159 domain-containing protein [Taklimakanibacter lacteus]|uniref:DUF4159 domain-containing protein n=1 Tax=Taklimakanibacter lacteus TaxID=2268456 RepID=UPI000E671C3E
MLQGLSFLTPWALAGLAALPVIWWLLRFTPPKPQHVRFPPLRLLLELVPREEQPDKTPWWLLLLRLALAALLILAVAHPLLSPRDAARLAGNPLLIVVDDSWAAAKDWDTRLAVLQDLAASAQQAGVPVAVAATSPSARPGDLAPQAAHDALSRLTALTPRALQPDRLGLLERLKTTFTDNSGLTVVWLSDGLDHGSAAAFARGLLALNGGQADLEVISGPSTAIPLALAAPEIEGGRMKIAALRTPSSEDTKVVARALAGNGRSLAETTLALRPGSQRAEGFIDLPLELRNEVERVELTNERSAAAIYLLDDRWRRKTVSLMAGSTLESAQPLLSPLYYVSRALEPYTEISEPKQASDLKNELDAGLSVLALADIGVLPQDEQDMIQGWVERGGLLLRFAGPRMAAAQDPLIPVTLREGGRALGSALSWETPQALQPFAETSPFAGLTLDTAVVVNRQVLAEPAADLTPKVWASLADGTPLVTAEQRGKGLIVLFHVTANADWSNLPLSGMFVEMLRRILDLAPSAGSGANAGTQVATSQAAFTPRRVLTGTGDFADPSPDAEPIAAADIDTAKPSPTHPAGLYNRGGLERAINLTLAQDDLKPMGALPGGAQLRGMERAPAIPLAPYLFGLAAALFLLDCIAALWLAGSWQRLKTRRAGAAIVILLVLGAAAAPDMARAQDAASDQFALSNTLQTRLAYVETGDAQVDETSRQGLAGLGNILVERTSVEPGEPVAVNLERDEIVFFPLIYWPILPDAQAPSPAALAKLNTYIKNGGTIFFDTREDGADLNSLMGEVSGATLALRRVVEKLDIPPLEPVPPDHVLTKAFYLLQAFPGRYERGQLWVESGEGGTGSGNADGVTSVIIGANDYAAAWAQDTRGQPLYATMPGGDRQREFAYRTGVNIVMYALTGNYKADQVHVPALLERLGQ